MTSTEIAEKAARKAAREIRISCNSFYMHYSVLPPVDDIAGTITKHILPLTTENAELKVEVEKLRERVNSMAACIVRKHKPGDLASCGFGVVHTKATKEYPYTYQTLVWDDWLTEAARRHEEKDTARTALASEVAGEGEKV